MPQPPEVARRPTPEELLERYRLASRPASEPGRRGRLRVFLGAAPGVGKTYAMLHEGHRLKSEGHDVVIGIVETHGRAETAEQIGDLEVVPRKVIAYRGVSVEEMDTDAVLRRRPEIVLVDELAHTNAPGSPRPKRWQVVEALRDAGIDVITTVNIQHLESLQDVIVGITGVQVQETVPDRLLEQAEVHLVDLPIAALIERLEAGKIYPPQQARQALEHFFREGNLTALRELALRQMAAGVNQQLADYMHDHQVEAIWPAAERIVALIDPGDRLGMVLRNAWRLAGAFRGDLLVVAVVPPGGLSALPADDRARLERNLQLAEDLAATPRLVEASDLAAALVEVVKEANATIVVLPHRPAGWWERATRPSLPDRLRALLDHVDLHLVGLEAPKS